MRIALIADIHSNLIALETVLRDIKKRGADRIISLGDQVNLGPCPREVLALLRAEGAVCLHGNHERYILSVMRGDPAYDGANFHSLRFNAGLLTPQDITFPETYVLDGITFCHAFPGDDRFPVNEPEKVMPVLLEQKRPLRIICGHGHNPTSYRLPGISLDSVGSTGCMDEGVPNMTLYTMMELERGAVSLQPVFLPYDPSPLYGLFKKSGMADFCPIMAHITCLQQTRNHDYLLAFVRKALALSRARGEDRVSEETWRAVDGLFPWPGGIGTEAFWKAGSLPSDIG